MIGDCLQRLHGPDAENAYFDLIEADESCVPALIQAYGIETSLKVRATLIEIIWQHRQPSTLEFLAEALRDNDEEIWRTALDGVVAVNSPIGLEVLSAEKERLRAEYSRSEVRMEWIEEAILQLSENLHSREKPNSE